MKNTKLVAALLTALAAASAFGGNSLPFPLDTRSGIRQARAVEPLAYSTAWNGATGVSIAIDGNEAFSSSAPASGDYVWNASDATAGLHTLTFNDGAETLNVQFDVHLIFFDANGGTGAMPNLAYTPDDTLTLPAMSFTRRGYSFVGWATSADGPVIYGDGAIIFGGIGASSNEVVTLYAQWGHMISVNVSGDGSCAFGTQWVAENTTATATLVPSTHLYAITLSGDTNGVTLAGTTLSIPADRPRSIGVSIAEVKLSLDVASAFGTATPGVGRTLRSWGDRITASVTEPAAAYGFRQHCSGWTGTGSVPRSGTGTSTTFTIQQDSSITWNWERQTWHECTIAGDATHKTESGWKPFNGTDNVIHFSPNGHPYRYELAGDTNGVIVDAAANTITLPTDRPRSVVLTVHVYTENEVIEDGGASLAWEDILSRSPGLSIRYYDVSSSGYSTWSQSEAALTNYFAALTPIIETNTLAFGATLDAGFAPVYTGSSDVSRISEIGSSSSANNRFHGRYANEDATDYAVMMSGQIRVDEAGEYSFRALADDYFAIFIDGIRVCRGQWNSIGTGATALTIGDHRIVLAFHQMGDGHGFAAQWKKPDDTAWSPLPQSILSHESCWSIAADESASDGFSLRSGAIRAGETSAVEATVSGAGTLTFDWRISSARGHFARFYVDGVVQNSITRTSSGWATVTATLGDGPHTLRWAYEKGTGETGGEDAAFVDNVVWTPLTLADALDTDAVVWSTDGAQPWIPQIAVSDDGTDAARSGAVTGLDVSALTATVLGAGTLSWSWKGDIAGNAGVDVFLDGDWCDSVWLEGETDWETASLAVTGSGTHTVRFEFWNGGTSEDISDCAYIDQVSWSGTEARTLAVASAFGTASPTVGTHVLARGGQITASVAAPGPTNGTRRVCTGWTGTGSVPASGTAASVAFTLNEDSSIEWNWRTDYRTEITVSGGSCNFAPQWVAAGTQVEVVITPSAHFPTISLSGDTAGATTLDGTTLRFVADRPRTLHVDVQEVPVPLTVASAHGSPSPAVGTHEQPWGTAVTASVTEPDPVDGTLFLCTGWTGTGSVPASGTATNVTFTLEERSSITWTWTTNVWLELACAGAVGADFAAGWVAKGDTVVAHWTPTAPYVVVSLSGDTTGTMLDETEQTLTIPADAPRSLTLSARTLTLAGALDASGLAWATTPAVPWFPQVETTADGDAAAQSGAVTNGAVSALETTLVAPGTLTWSWRLDAQGGDAALRILLDGEPAGTCLAGAGWTSGTLAIDAIGAHTVRFEFRNDGVSADGSRAYLDQVTWTGDTDVTVDGWFDVNFADPGYRAGHDWSDVSQVTNPGGTWELADARSFLAEASENQERRVELNGTTGIVYRATHASEAGADIRIEGRMRMSIGFRNLSICESFVGLTICYLDETETQAAPYGVVDGAWVQLQSPSQPLLNDAWHDYVIELDQRSELAPRIRYTLDGESLGLATGGDSWIPLESAPDEIGEALFEGLGAIGNFRGFQTKFVVPIADLEIPDLSGPGGVSFGTDGSGNPTFNVRVANPVPGVYYTAFVADTLSDTFRAEASSHCAEAGEETILFAIAAGDDHPSRFVRIVASTYPFAVGDPLPEDATRR